MRQDTVAELMFSIETSTQTENWYAALAVILMLPDVCASCDPKFAGMTVKQRYCRWFEIFSSDDKKVIINSDLRYEIRCKFLHQASLTPKKRCVLDLDIGLEGDGLAVDADMIVFTSDDRVFAHGNFYNSRLQLSVASFCRSIIGAVARWLVEERSNALVQREIAAMTKIESSLSLFG